MRDREQFILDLFNSGEEVFLPDIVDQVIDPKQERKIKTSGAERSPLRTATNYVRSVLVRNGVAFRATKKHTLKKLTTARDYQLERQRVQNKIYRSLERIREIESEMLSKKFPIQITADYEGGAQNVSNEKPNQTVAVTPASSKSKKAVNS